jgi:GAF domain-containing protein
MIGARSMSEPESYSSNEDRMLAKMGSRYIQYALGRSQLASLFLGPPIGLMFSFITAKLNLNQAVLFVLSLFIFIGLANILPPILTRRGTRQAKDRLDHIFNDKPLPENNDAYLSWKEILTLPGRMAFSQFLSALVLVMIPMVITMKTIGGVSWYQVVAITVGGLLAVMAMLIQSILNTDNRLAPIRRALLPENAGQQDVQLSVGSAVRHYFIVGFLVLAALLTTGVVVYGQFTAATLPGANVSVIRSQLLLQLGIFGAIIFILGLFLASRLLHANTRPIQEMSRTLKELQKGNYYQRAAIVTSDETTYLTIHLNQLLDQLQIFQAGLEKQVEERTSELSRKTNLLHTAAFIGHEASGIQDVSKLLQRVAELIANRFSFSHTGIFLLDDSGEFVILHAASSEEGQHALAQGYRLEIAQATLVGASVLQNRYRVVADYETESNFLKDQNFPDTHSELAIPLATRGKILGVLDIHSSQPSTFHPDDIELFQAMADQIALAIQNANLIVENQAALQQLETAATKNVQRTWREQLRSSKQAYRYTPTSVATVTNIGNLPSLVSKDPNSLHIPVMLRGQQLGTIILRRSIGVEWNEMERSLANEIATQVGLALENARLLEEAQRRASQEASLSDLASKLSRSLDPGVLLQTAIRELHQLPNVSGVSVYLAPTAPQKVENKD